MIIESNKDNGGDIPTAFFGVSVIGTRIDVVSGGMLDPALADDVAHHLLLMAMAIRKNSMARMAKKVSENA